MPFHQGIWLHNHQRLFPSPHSARQYHRNLSIPLRQLRTSELSLQHNQLLAQEHVFRDQLALAARQIR
jgi:hypothetical protein